MKYLLLFAFFIAAACCYGQQIKGSIIDKNTKMPVNGAMVSLGSTKVFTNAQGMFSINAPGINDTLAITHFAYQTYLTTVSKIITTIHIELTPLSVTLNEVVIHANREHDFKKDSADNRKAFAKEFNYTGPKVTDAFVRKPIVNTSELVTIDVFTLIRALTKKSSPEYKFKQVLLRDEQADYVDQKFNRGIVAPITGLHADTLSEFLVRYRPTYQFAKKATDYDMINYIKDSYKKFKKEGYKNTDPFRKEM